MYRHFSASLDMSVTNLQQSHYTIYAPSWSNCIIPGLTLIQRGVFGKGMDWIRLNGDFLSPLAIDSLISQTATVLSKEPVIYK